jgi:hypothetical protein
MRVRTLADGLGYSHPDQLTRLIRRNKTEFEGKLFTVKLTGNSPGAPELIINYHGVIRAAMLLCSAGQTKKDRIEPELPWKGSDIFRESRLS